VDVPIVGDVKDGLQKALRELEKRKSQLTAYRKRVKPGTDQVHEWQSSVPLSYAPAKGQIRPQQLVEALRDECRRDAIGLR
jgi:acetolactate synthase-1/2/3 large subunit